MLCAAALALAACTSPAESTTPLSTAKADNASDPCSLLTSDEVTEHLRGEPADPKSEKPQGRPSCLWRTNENRYEIRLMLWHPPMPDIQRDNDKLDVAGHPGYVTSGTAVSCLVDIDLGDIWLQVESRTPAPDDPKTETDDLGCQRAGELAALAINRL